MFVIQFEYYGLFLSPWFCNQNNQKW